MGGEEMGRGGRTREIEGGGDGKVGVEDPPFMDHPIYAPENGS